jgi:hypothetical protein
MYPVCEMPRPCPSRVARSNAHIRSARHPRVAFLLACATLLAGSIVWPIVGPVGVTHADDEFHWKQVTQGEVKIDDKPPIGSGLYQPLKKGKKKDTDINTNLVLVLLGHRYLMIDLKAKTIYQVLPSDLKAQGSDFESDDLAQPSRVVSTSDWTSRDVGPAELITVTLGDYGRTLTIEIPHTPDLRAFY